MTTQTLRVSLSGPIIADLIGKIYTAAADPSAWNDFLSSLARAGGGSCSAITYHSKCVGQHMLAAQHGVPPSVQQDYLTHYGALDVWYKSALRVAHVGWVGDGRALVSEHDLSRSEFYNDHLRTNEDLFHFCGAVLQMDGAAIGSLGLLRTRRAGPFNRNHIRLMRILLPHAQRAVQLHSHFLRLRDRCDMLETALERVTTGVVFVDAAGSVLFANRTANALLCRSDGLISGRDGLRSANVSETTRLQRMIRGAANTGSGNGLSSGGVVQISRAFPRLPLTLLIAPAPRVVPGLHPYHPAAAIFITDPDQRAVPDGEIFRRVYGLTRAECELACHLADGATLHTAAEQRHVTISTARSQLKSIFRKLNVSTQSQLVRLIMMLPRSAKENFQ
jgi:DNA-binding CsgD family transcriptional regulator/PAS domain-containing protein